MTTGRRGERYAVESGVVAWLCFGGKEAVEGDTQRSASEAGTRPACSRSQDRDSGEGTLTHQWLRYGRLAAPAR
jgi:hypothetical protein